jgi:hypothetical protein
MKRLVWPLLGFIALSACSRGSNIEERKAYWGKEIASSLKAGASADEIKDFAKARGQFVECYQNYQRENNCSFGDSQSIGGTRTHPVRLSVIFKMDKDVLTSHEFGMRSAQIQAQ